VDHAADITASLREVMREHPAGVVIVTVVVDGRPWGTTLSSFTLASLDPPLVLFCLVSTTTPARAILQEGAFGVSFVTAQNVDVARVASAAGRPKFLDDLAEAPYHGAPPVLRACRGSLTCRLENAVAVGDHTAFIGSVSRVITGPGGPPVAYCDGEYRLLKLT